MFNRLSSKNSLFAIKFLLITLCGGMVSSQETTVSNEPFFKFETILSEAALSDDGRALDVIIEYMANGSGEVDVNGISAFESGKYNQLSEVEGIDFFGDKLGDCECFKRRPPLKGVACYGSGCGGSGGPLGPLLSQDLILTLAPELDSTGEKLSFEFTVQQVGSEQFLKQSTPALEANELGEFLIDEMLK